MADEETGELFAKEFRCWGGMVRVYQPRVRFDYVPDARRHRFFTAATIQEIGVDEVVLQIVRACCRRGSLLGPEDVASVEDVRANLRMYSLRQLALEKKTEDPELEALINSVQQDNEEYKRQIEQFRVEIDFMETCLAEQDDDLRAVRNEYEHYKQRTQDAYEQVRHFEGQLEVIKALHELPENLERTLEMVAGLHSGRIVVLEDALKSAQRAGLDDKSLPVAWKCLWSVATVLHDLFFLPDQPDDKEMEFRSRTGFDLVMTDGKQTKQDAKLMKLRRRHFEGRDIDITPHVKWGNKAPKCLRVHFHIDTNKNRLVIGHCGDHLDNYSTQFMR
jgi:archaellum component FlaC